MGLMTCVSFNFIDIGLALCLEGAGFYPGGVSDVHMGGMFRAPAASVPKMRSNMTLATASPKKSGSVSLVIFSLKRGRVR